MEGKTDNELIAEFMGLPLTKKSRTFSGTGHDVEIPFMTWRYNQSWDWLMPVVEKIENVLSKPGSSNMKEWDFWNDQFDGEINTDIEVAYSSVVEFIKWYNRQKEK